MVLHSQEQSVDRNWGTQVTQTPNLEGQAATESRSSILKPLQKSSLVLFQNPESSVSPDFTS
jgi:hypothetical protein